ncbi:FHA domain-containing protein [Nostoc sp. CHAB 5834]|nr:FHA domain-containing protein [Nostoc sp. CHAB 5834]
MNTLPLQQWAIAFRWEHNGNFRDKKISKLEAARDNLNGAIIRIGRDQPSCNLYLEDSSVSGQHAEIYFNEQQQKFFIKSLQPKNTLQVDGQDLVYGKELPLKENSTIVLGLQRIEITGIQIYELQSTNYSGVVNSSQNSNLVNQNPNPANPNLNSIPVNLNVNVSNANPNQSKYWWQEPTIQVAIIGAIVTLVGALLTWNANRETQLTEIKKAKEQKGTELAKTNIETLAKKQEKAEDRYYQHKAENLKLEKEAGKLPQITLRNECDKSINIAINYTALNDIQQTRGWFILNKDNKKTFTIFRRSGIFLYASTYDNKYEFKEGDTIRDKYTVNRDFDYIADDLTLFYPSDKERKEYELKKKDFYLVNLDEGDFTTKTFTCADEKSLKLN